MTKRQKDRQHNVCHKHQKDTCYFELSFNVAISGAGTVIWVHPRFFVGFCLLFCRSLLVLLFFFRLIIGLSVLWFTVSDYPFDVFKLLLIWYLNTILIITLTPYWKSWNPFMKNGSHLMAHLCCFNNINSRTLENNIFLFLFFSTDKQIHFAV
jgi:hypothetical protein